MDNWISLLLVAVFFVLPLIQELLKALRGRRAEETPGSAPTTTEAEGMDPTAPVGRRERVSLPAPETAGAAPGGNLEAVVGRDRKARVEEAVREMRSRAGQEVASHDTVADQERLTRERQVRPEIPTESQGRRVRASSNPARPPARSRPVGGKQTNQPAIRRQLSTAAGLKNSIILGEVLAPPVSMRDPDQKL